MYFNLGWKLDSGVVEKGNVELAGIAGMVLPKLINGKSRLKE